MAERQKSTSRGLVSALSERFKIRSASETRPAQVFSKTEPTPPTNPPSTVAKRPPLARNTTTTTTNTPIGQPSTSKPPPAMPPAVVGPKQFKKCKSATFQIDGHYYTIGLYRFLYYFDVGGCVMCRYIQIMFAIIYTQKIKF